jgi:hypothetical protein
LRRAALLVHGDRRANVNVITGILWRDERTTRDRGEPRQELLGRSAQRAQPIISFETEPQARGDPIRRSAAISGALCKLEFRQGREGGQFRGCAWRRRGCHRPEALPALKQAWIVVTAPVGLPLAHEASSSWIDLGAHRGTEPRMPPKATQLIVGAIGTGHLTDEHETVLRQVIRALEDARKARFAEPQVNAARALLHDALRSARWPTSVHGALTLARQELAASKPVAVRPRPRAPRLAGYGPPKTAQQKDAESAARRAAYWKWLKDHGYILPGISEKGRVPRLSVRRGDGAMICASCKVETCARGEYWCQACQG